MAIQQRLPTGDDSVQWDRSTGIDNYALVDDPVGTPDEHDTYTYMDSAIVRRDYFSFTAFSIPVGSTINSVKVKNRTMRIAADSANQRLMLKVNGTAYEGDEFSPAQTVWTDYFHTWTTNPDTESAWTVADVNGTGDNPLQTFGYKHELESYTQVRCTQVYLEVDYTLPIKLLAGVSAIKSTATGQIKAIRKLAGTTACTIVVTGNIKAIRSISRTTRCKSRVIGELTVEALKILAGTSVISSTTAGILKATRKIAGTSVIASTTAGILSKDVPLAGVVAIESTVIGELKTTRELAGTVAIESAVIGELSSPIRALAGIVAIESTTAGILSKGMPLAGAVAITSTVAGVLKATKGLVGAVAIESTVIGELESPVRELSGVVAIESTTAGVLTKAGFKELAGVSAISSTTSGAMSLVGALAGVVEIACVTSGSISLLRELAGTVVISTTVTGILIKPYITIPSFIEKTLIDPYSGGAWLWLAKIFVSDEYATRRIARNTENVIYGGETFEKFNFDIGKQTFAGDGKVPRIMLRTSQDPDIENIINASKGAHGGTIKIIRVNENFTAFEVEALEAIYSIISAESDFGHCIFTLGIPNPLSRRIPLRIYNSKLCPYAVPTLFKGPECQYEGGLTACTGTIEDCRDNKINQVHWGGELGLSPNVTRV